MKFPMLRLKSIAAITPSNLDKTTEPDEIPARLCNYVDVYKHDRITGDMPFMTGSATPAEVRRFALRAGDVIITKDSETPADIAVPAYVDASAEGVLCGYHLALLRPRPHSVNGRFLFWSLKSAEVASAFSKRAQGITRFGLTVGAIGGVPVPVPDLSTQQAIADFLDRETARIDALVAKQEAFLARLDEHWRSVVAEAITRGLHPGAPLRKTGLLTFPSIPAHWQMKPLMRLVPPSRPINYGVLMPGPSVPEGIPLIEAGDVMAGPIRPDHLRRTTPEIEVPFARSRLQPGDVVVAIRGSVGTAEVVPPDLTNANVTRDAARVSPRPEVDASYLAFVIGSVPMQGFFASRSLGAAVQGINITDLKRAPIPLPPLSEQREIAAHIQAHRARLVSLRACATEMIERLREHRAALITAAVTGGIAAARPLADRGPGAAQAA